METQIIFIYCLTDRIVQVLNLKDDPQAKKIWILKKTSYAGIRQQSRVKYL
ncbi:MAG: hypothetical protein Tsb0015_07380 [Simkaniaceae bacterium]